VAERKNKVLKQDRPLLFQQRSREKMLLEVRSKVKVLLELRSRVRVLLDLRSRVKVLLEMGTSAVMMTAAVAERKKLSKSHLMKKNPNCKLWF
jgi:hypothetical protein